MEAKGLLLPITLEILPCRAYYALLVRAQAPLRTEAPRCFCQAAHHARDDQVRALDLRPAVCADGGHAGGARLAQLAAGLWLIVAMVAARSAAMTFNRIADLKLDALNPRTRMRALPTGQLSLRFAIGFTLLSCALLVLAARELSPLAFKLSPLALAVLIAYSYTKRFTVLSHCSGSRVSGCRPSPPGLPCGARSA